jgi:CubicO group peptidase (beta-lactamase class C family)
VPGPQPLPAGLVAEGHTIPVAWMQAMHEGKRRARARRAGEGNGTAPCSSVRIVANTGTAERWAARLHDLAADEDVPGAVLGVWADGQESVAAHGVLNAATGVETTPDSLFQIGSITKVWTTTMIMQLTDNAAGRLTPWVSAG